MMLKSMYILVRYAEISLKGKNKPFFEKKLTENIKECLKKSKIPYTNIKILPGRILIKIDESLTYAENEKSGVGNCNQYNIYDVQRYMCLKTVFGVQDFGIAYFIPGSMEKIKEMFTSIVEGMEQFQNAKTFRITSKRIHKSLPFTSMEADKAIGAFVAIAFGKKVQLKEPDIEIEIEFTAKGSYILFNRIKCFAGLPVTSQGKVFSLIEDNISDKYMEKSLLASILMMKTGCEIIPLVINNNIDLSLLEVYAYGFKISPIILNASIKDICNDDSNLMFKELSELHNVNVLITGQTMDRLHQISELTNLNPLIAFNEEEIKEKLEVFKNACLY